MYKHRFFSNRFFVSGTVKFRENADTCSAPEEVIGEVDGHREDDGRVVLGRDAVQRLQVAQLKREKLDELGSML
jgi:hypothetical protein